MCIVFTWEIKPSNKLHFKIPPWEKSRLLNFPCFLLGVFSWVGLFPHAEFHMWKGCQWYNSSRTCASSCFFPEPRWVFTGWFTFSSGSLGTDCIFPFLSKQNKIKHCHSNVLSKYKVSGTHYCLKTKTKISSGGAKADSPAGLRVFSSLLTACLWKSRWVVEPESTEQRKANGLPGAQSCPHPCWLA